MKKTIALVALIAVVFNSQAQTVGPWDLDRLSQVPIWKETETALVPGMKGILYESIPYKEKPVEVFAYYSAPKGHIPEGGWPAVVCVHGGGGTAFHEWVQIWNDHGFAAISMDLEGSIPVKPKENARNRRISTPNPGPKRDGIFNNYALPLEQQWYYHAVAQIILANSLIHSLPEVNPNKIGITGISWGGTLTSTIMGVDKRFKFAIPVYGCGFLPGSDGNQGVAIKEGQHSEIVNKYWDGSAYFGNTTIPTFWVNGTNDKHFPMPSIQKSSQAVKAPATLRIQLRMKHGHYPGWEPEEIYVFANSVVSEGDQLLRFGKPQRSGTQASVSFTFNGKTKEAELLYTRDEGIWPARNWEKTPASISGNSISVRVPEGTTTLFFNATDERGLMVSSEYIQIK